MILYSPISFNTDALVVFCFQLRGCVKHVTQSSGDSRVDQAKLNAWTSALFNCFATDRHPLLASALLRFCGQSTVEVTDSTIPRFATLDKQTRQALANAFVAYFNGQVGGFINARLNRPLWATSASLMVKQSLLVVLDMKK